MSAVAAAAAPSLAAAASAAPRPFIIHLLCMPAANGPLMPPPDADAPADSPAHAQWGALKALVHRPRAVAQESLAISHVVCTSSDGLSSALIALVQSNLSSAGLARAETFYSSGSAPPPTAMLRELMEACLASDDAAAEAAPAEAFPPCVDSAAFRRSFAATRLPRILLLAPSAKHAFNLALHRGILALDAHAHRGEINQSQAHCYNNPTNAGIVSAQRRQSNTASASAAPVAPLLPMQHAPLIPRDSSVFGLDLIAPVLLEYVLHRSVTSRVWSDVHRLQAEIETPGRANAPSSAEQDALTLKLSSYPDPQSAGSHSLAAHTIVAKHTRIFTALSVHKLQPIVLVSIELESEMASAQAAAREADKSVAASAPVLSRAERSALAARNDALISAAVASLAALRVLSAFSSARQVVFDDSDAGRALAGDLERMAPQFAFKPVWLPLGRAMDLYAFCLGDSGNSSSSSSSALASELIVVGSKADLAPLLSLLLNGGRRHHLRLSAGIVSAAWDTFGPAVEVQHVTPEIPSALLRVSPIAAEADAEGEASSLSIEAQLCSSRFHGSRVLNGSFTPLAAAAKSDAS